MDSLTDEPDSDKVNKDFLCGLVDITFSRAKYIKKKLFPERFFPKMEVISFVGMAGIGKTTFVKKIFEYIKKLHNFHGWLRVWVSLGPKYQSGDVLIDILAQIFPEISKKELKGDVELANDLSRQLSNKRFLIVLDDVWNEAPLRDLARLFPNIKGRALVTTRFAQVGKSKMIDIIREMRFLSKEESWDLLRQKVFCNGRSCPLELQKAGKKIAENCDGLPLTIVKVAKLMSKDLSPQYWKDVAKKNSDFTNALRELSKTLQPCYESLPLYLKPCFLYMGVFPENYKVSTTKVLQLWTAEGFLEPGLSQRDEDFAVQCLLELVNRSLVMVCHKGTSSYGVQTCRLNSVLWHLSNDEATKNQFFHAYDDSVQGMKNQRRFSIRNCILLRIKGIHDSMMDSVATARSLVCTGPYHQYQLPVCFELRLLRVLDILVIRFYKFPIEVVKLIHLRHLAITCDENLPTSISKLWNLQFLIVSRHLRIKSFGDSSSYLPMEIWDMKELRHLQVTGSSLPTPNCGTMLPNLVTLLDMSPNGCTEEVLKAIPNLKKLGLRVELAPGDAMPYHYLDHISNSLSQLESIKCNVVNPEVGFEVVALPPHLWMFSSNLVKLSLSGLGYPWIYMRKFCCWLGNLEVLKLKCYAFQGEKWKLCDDGFRKLKHLIIEDTDLVWWKTTTFSLGELRHLSIKHCYNLEELPHFMGHVEMIEVVDCNPFTVKWAKQMRESNTNPRMPMATDRVLTTHVESSWDVVQPQFERLVIIYSTTLIYFN